MRALKLRGNGGASKPSGDVGLRIVRAAPVYPQDHYIKTADLLRSVLRDGTPSMKQERVVRRYKFKNLPHMMRGVRHMLAVRALHVPSLFGDLRLVVTRDSDGARFDLGLVSLRLVTDNGVARIVDAFDNTLADADQRYHGIGTGVAAEAQTDSALGTELTTQYNPDNTRATGTFSQPAANQSRSVATNTVDAAVAITEHGIFSQAATGGGTLLDRSVFSAVNLASGDSLQSTYTLSLTAGG